MADPQRSCIACRRKYNQGSFLRISRNRDGRVDLWSGSGRSAYICPHLQCIEVGLGKGRLERALRCRVTEEDRDALRQVLICKLR